MTAAGWAWLMILGIVLVFEPWAVLTHGETLSEWLRRHRVAKWLGVLALSAFIVHVLAQREGPRNDPVICGEECEGE